MKKIITLLLALTMALTLVGCGSNNETVTTETDDTTEELVGGWEMAESPVVTDEVKEVVEKATGDLLGATYTPIVYIASQVVEGTNYLVLCKVELTTATPVIKYVLLTINEDLDGSTLILESKETPSGLVEGDVVGGWTLAESPELTDDVVNVVTNATSDLIGCTYEAVALVATQVVSGTNYCILCKLTPVSLNGDSHYALLYAYVDLNGDTQLLNIEDFCVEETDDEGSVKTLYTLDELNSELGSNFQHAEDALSEYFYIFTDENGTRIGEYDFTVDIKTYQVRFCDDFNVAVTGVVTGEDELFSDPTAEGFNDFTVDTSTLIFYVAHWCTTDGQYAMIVDTNELSEEDFTTFAQSYKESTVRVQ